MTVLMLLAMMTYARLESFRGFTFVQSQFKEYMQKTERNYGNEQAWIRYEAAHGSTREKKEEQENEKNPASPKLSFNLFINKEERAKYPAELETHITIAKNLMNFLYGDQKFFNEMLEKRPEFLDEIFASLMQMTAQHANKEKLNTKKLKEIATVDLGDPELNKAFTKMLQGTVEKVEDAGADDENLESASTETLFKPKRGYYSLLDFITIQRNKLRIRVFLASPQLLMAIYGNSATVQDILNMRNRLYKQLINKEISPELGKEEFQSLFQNIQLPEVPVEMLDFGISKTDPHSYVPSDK
jgi:hypothetical protein